MSAEASLVVDYSQQEATSTFLPCLPILSSHLSNWKSINLAYYQLPPWEIPEIASPQHTIILATPKHFTESELIVGSRSSTFQYYQQDRNSICILPAELPMRTNWNQEIEFIHCYLDAAFLTHAAYESVNPDRVDLNLTIQATDPLIWQLGLALKVAVETDPNHSCFYAESLATAMAAHLLRFYTTRKQVLRADLDPLTRVRLQQAIEYINAYLHEDLSLAAIAAMVGMSQYYFCRLFKQSVGMSPYAYLIQQRIERAKQLLKQSEGTILEVALMCGFANPSYFAKCFRRYVGVTPKRFRQI